MSLALDAVYALAAAAAAPWWMRKARGGWAERFGRIDALPAPTRSRVLIHAVSVGEVNLARPLVERLIADAEVVVSVTTDTGIARAREVYTGRAAVVRYPLDASWSVRRFLDAVRPDAVALCELEMWPNFLSACAARGIPVGVVNGRLSPRSFKRYFAARGLLRGMFQRLAFVAAQDESYAERFRSMGVPAERCHAAGNLKWDSASLTPPPGAEDFAREFGMNRAAPLVVAGSTAPGEPELLRAALPEGVQLLCAPRKPEWFDAAESALQPCARLTRVRTGTGAHGVPRASRFLLDTIGELRQAYALADVVVIGRSFGDLFGSDPMEAAALGKPIIIGPAHTDFAQSVTALRESGGLIVSERAGLSRTLGGLLNDESARRRMGEAARACVVAHQGAADRQARMVGSMLAHSTARKPE